MAQEREIFGEIEMTTYINSPPETDKDQKKNVMLFEVARERERGECM
jgi:hypothetical protein